MLSRVNTNNVREDSELHHGYFSHEFLQGLAWVMGNTRLPPTLTPNNKQRSHFPEHPKKSEYKTPVNMALYF